MRQTFWVLAAWLALADGSAFAQKSQPSAITWKKTVVDKAFRSEGVAVADFNKDGKPDIFVGDVWYEAPDWKMHVIRRDKPFDPAGYSESFGCFAEDFNGDGYPDVVVIPFPGKQCFWYENPGKAGGKWKEHLAATSSCNETPIYVDLFKTGKKVLLMGWNPPGKDDMGEMCYFLPGKDPTQLWEKHSISGPSAKGKTVPGTQRFAHGLGHGDVNGDGRIDVIVPQGWWEQPEKVVEGATWVFHKADLGPSAADMYAVDIDGNGLNDVISSSAHNTGFWWHQQVAPGKFMRKEFFSTPHQFAKLPAKLELSKEEAGLFAAVVKARAAEFRAPWALTKETVEWARHQARLHGGSKDGGAVSVDGKPAHTKVMHFAKADPTAMAKELMPAIKEAAFASPHLNVGVGIVPGKDGGVIAAIVLVDQGRFALFGQSHALLHVDINGDGTKDFVTGRRWWAHGARGDDFPSDPAYVYWFETRKNKEGHTSLIPHLIDDASGIGTQFVVIDIDGDGIPDVVVSNKRGVFIHQQVRAGATAPQPGRKD